MVLIKGCNYHQVDFFQALVDRNSLIELLVKGCFNTWCNNHTQGCVKEKVDRVLHNVGWLACSLMFRWWLSL